MWWVGEFVLRWVGGVGWRDLRGEGGGGGAGA